MRDDIRNQLAEYGAFHEERQGSVDIDSLFEAVTPIPPHVEPTRTGSRGWLVALAAGIAVILVVGLLPILLRGGTSVQPSATTVPTTAPTSTMSEPGLDTAPVSGLSFTGASLPGNAPEVGLVALPSPTPGDKATIEALSPSQPSAQIAVGRVFWTHYTSGPLTPQSQGLEGLQDVSIREAPSGHVLTGQENGRNVAWSSSDGKSWAEWPVDEPIDRDRGFSWFERPWAEIWDGSSASLWFHSGDSWQQVETPDDIRSFTEPVTSGSISVVGGVGATGDILIVINDGGTASQIAAPWTRPGLPHQELHIVALPADGFASLVTSYDNEWPGTLGETGLWTSTDGTTWVDHGPIPFVSEMPTHIEVLDSGGAASVRVDHDVDDSRPSPEYWESEDGITWTSIAAPEPVASAFSPTRAACDAEGSRCVETDLGLVLFLWTGGRETELWVSPDDGITWEQIPPPQRDFLSDPTISVRWNTDRNPGCCMLDLGAAGRVIWWNDMDDGLWIAHVK